MIFADEAYSPYVCFQMTVCSSFAVLLIVPLILVMPRYPRDRRPPNGQGAEPPGGAQT